MGSDSTLTGQDYFLNLATGFCNSDADCTMLAGRVGVMFTDGTPATPSTGVYIHHILSADRNKKEEPFISACDSPSRSVFNVAGLTVGQSFLGTGEDSGGSWSTFTNKEATAGYHMKKGDKITAWAKLVNYNKKPVDVYLTYDIEWKAGLVGDNVRYVLNILTEAFYSNCSEGNTTD